VGLRPVSLAAVTGDGSDTTGEFTPAPDGSPQSLPANGGQADRATTSKAPRKSRPPKRHRWARRTALGVALLLVIAMVLGGAGWFYVNYRIGQITTVNVPVLNKKPAPKPGQPFNILLVGSDSRADCKTPTCESHLGSQGTSGGQRSDVIIILRVVPATRQLAMLSIPRDTFVPIANSGGSYNKINAAFNYGPNQLVATIEDDFHIPIDHYAYANFWGFTSAIAALGGIYLDFPDPIKDDVVGFNEVKTGCQLVSAVRVLKLVRSRDLQYEVDGEWHYDGLADLSRIRRQQSFFHAVIEKVDSDHNPLAINAFIGDVVHDIELDNRFTKSELRDLALEFRGVSSSNLTTEVIPTIGAVYGGADILLPATSDDNAMIKKFLEIGTAPTSSSSTTSTSSTSTTTTTSLAVTGTTTVVINDTSKYYPEPWNPYPCTP
jgi:polyisoprenyl-teichoic acid--peptidoglycan teichoic acid transferase